MAEKLGIKDIEDTLPCLSLHECADGVTSAMSCACVDHPASCRTFRAHFGLFTSRVALYCCPRPTSGLLVAIFRLYAPHALTRAAPLPLPHPLRAFLRKFIVVVSSLVLAVEAPLGDSVPVISVISSWAPDEDAKLVLTVKLFTDRFMASVDPKIIYLFYIQGIYNVLSGIYPTGVDESVSLAALQMQAKFGDHNPEVYVTPTLVFCPWFALRV